MLQNAPLLAIVAVHTAENEASKVGDRRAQRQFPGRLPLHELLLQRAERGLRSSHDFFLLWIIKNHVYSVEQTDLVLPCSKTFSLDEKFVDTAKNQPLKAHKLWAPLSALLLLFSEVRREHRRKRAAEAASQSCS